MRVLALTACVLASSAIASAGGAEPKNKEHPDVVALSQSTSGEWVYKSFPQLTRLYVTTADGPRKSGCDDTCATAWPPLAARDDDKAGRKVGNWSVVVRDNGQKQWAYKGQPVHLRFHDLPEDSYGVDVEGFRQLEP
jgi:predicted lipoprotein with Yx(FWY)xxD motif